MLAMKPPSVSTAADVRGAARLARDATTGLTNLVEAVHERIVRLPGSATTAAAQAGRTRGLTGLVYKTIRGVTHVVGGSLDALLGLLAPALNALGAVPEREALVAALNGVLGDHLAASNNPLATVMSLHPAQVEKGTAPAATPAPAPAPASAPEPDARMLLLIHGLCMNDLQWTRDGHNHGLSLARELGLTPMFLRYNSGLHISTNGRALAQLLQQWLDSAPQPAPQLVIIGHSMGGLVARSAVHFARQAGMSWPQHLTDLVFLGTPHHGAPLERAGNWIDVVLGATPYAKPFARLGQVRSAGITDLRHGYVQDEDWRGQDRFARRAAPHLHLPLPDGVRCFAVAGHIGADDAHTKGRLSGQFWGDGLVPLASALGQHVDPARCLAFAPDRQWTGASLNHLQLLSDTRVHAQLRRWLVRPDA